MTAPLLERPNLAGLRVRSARLSYGGPGRLDVTMRSTNPLGARFAPTEDLLGPMIRRRHDVAALMKRARATVKGESTDEAADRIAMFFEQAVQLETQIWNEYRPAYLAERRVHAGLVHHRGWEQLDALEQLAWRRGVRPRPEDWMALREAAWVEEDGPILVFVCFCAEDLRAHCHTRLLCVCCQKLGAIDEGEVPAAEQKRTPPTKKGPAPV